MNAVYEVALSYKYDVPEEEKNVLKNLVYTFDILNLEKMVQSGSVAKLRGSYI